MQDKSARKVCFLCLCFISANIEKIGIFVRELHVCDLCHDQTQNADSFVRDDTDSENENGVEAVPCTSSDSDEADSSVKRSHSLRRRESLHRQRDSTSEKKHGNHTRSRSSFLQPQKSETKESGMEGEETQSTNERTAATGDDLADELNKLSKKLEEIETRLMKNERRTDLELRKLNSRQKEEKVAVVTRRNSDRRTSVQPPSTGFAGLRRSATDFFRIKSRLGSSASVTACRPEEAVVHVADHHLCVQSAAKRCYEPPHSSSSGHRNKQSLSQRLQKSTSSVFRAASGIPSLIRPHLKREKCPEYSSTDSVNNCSINSSTGSKNKLSSTSLSAEEEAFEQCYKQRFRRSPLRAFVDDKILRRRHGPLRDSLDSTASAVDRSHNGTSSWDSDCGSPAGDRLSSPSDRRESSQSRASVADEVFEVEGKHLRANTIRLPPTPDGKRARKHRAYSTPNTQQNAMNKPALLVTPTLAAAAAADQEAEAAIDSPSSSRAAITPDILAEIEMYRYMAFQRAAKAFPSRNKHQ